MTSRNPLWLSGLAGLALAALLTMGVAGVIKYGLPPVVVSATGRLVLLLFVLFFSVVEIPLMVIALRRIAASSTNVWVIAITHTAFVFFAAFYAALYTLLTGQIWTGVALASLSLVRLGASLAFVPVGQSSQNTRVNQ